jgi:Cu-Zn family superoxide dismutase
MKKTQTLNVAALALAGTILAFSAGCARDVDTTAISEPPPGGLELSAVAQLSPTQGNKARGLVQFKNEPTGVRVTADITGLTPGEHGFHVHENGDCSAPDASSAGGHFNPTNQSHGARDAEVRHIGDLGNLVADANGQALLNYIDPKLTLTGPNSIIGRAVIVHAGRDDLKSQPSGDAGGRVACGTIERVQGTR